MDLNSLTSQYLQKNKDANFDDIKSAVDNLTISYRESFDREARDGSIFSKYEDSDGLTQDEFISLMCEATGKSKSEIEKDAILLYQVLNSDNDLSSLTNEELTVLMDEGEITSFTVWSGLALNEETVKEKTKASSEDKKVDDNVAIDDDAAVDDDVPVNDEVPKNDEVPPNDENQEPDIKPYTGDFSDPEDAIAYIESLYDSEQGLTTPRAIINYLESEKLLPPDDIAALKEAYKRYDDKTEELIEKRMSVQNGRTREEIVAQLKSEGIITEDTPTNICNEEIVIEKSEEERLEIESYVDQLYGATAGRTGSSDGQFRKILMDSSLSDEEIVSIVKRYNEKYGSMVQDIDQDFSWMSGESEYMGRIAQALINEAKKGNEDALFYLTTEVHNATAGYDSATADSFMQQVFNKIDDTTLKHLANLYQTKYQNDLTLAIMNDFSWATNESWYLDKINNARKNG